jgi:hypothetical protein
MGGRTFNYVSEWRGNFRPSRLVIGRGRMNVRKTRLPTMAEIVAKRELGAVCNLTCWRDQDRTVHILSLTELNSISPLRGQLNY